MDGVPSTTTCPCPPSDHYTRCFRTPARQSGEREQSDDIHEGLNPFPPLFYAPTGFRIWRLVGFCKKAPHSDHLPCPIRGLGSGSGVGSGRGGLVAVVVASVRLRVCGRPFAKKGEIKSRKRKDLARKRLNCVNELKKKAGEFGGSKFGTT